MVVSLEEMKGYLRIDGSEDDVLITSFLVSAEELCRDILRVEDIEAVAEGNETVRTAIMFCVTYLYENREAAVHKGLTLTLRSLLFGVRKEVF